MRRIFPIMIALMTLCFGLTAITEASSTNRLVFDRGSDSWGKSESVYSSGYGESDGGSDSGYGSWGDSDSVYQSGYGGSGDSGHGESGSTDSGSGNSGHGGSGNTDSGSGNSGHGGSGSTNSGSGGGGHDGHDRQDGHYGDQSYTIPEPATIILLGSGLLGMIALRKRFYSQK